MTLFMQSLFGGFSGFITIWGAPSNSQASLGSGCLGTTLAECFYVSRLCWGFICILSLQQFYYYHHLQMRKLSHKDNLPQGHMENKWWHLRFKPSWFQASGGLHHHTAAHSSTNQTLERPPKEFPRYQISHPWRPPSIRGSLLGFKL